MQKPRKNLKQKPRENLGKTRDLGNKRPRKKKTKEKRDLYSKVNPPNNKAILALNTGVLMEETPPQNLS